jgi:hypothetical protein
MNKIVQELPRGYTDLDSNSNYSLYFFAISLELCQVLIRMKV